MGRSCLAVILVLFLSLMNIGGCNVFNDLSDKTSDAALSEDIQKYIDKSMWYDAYNKWQTLSPTGKTQRSNKVLLATIYAGWGGLDLIALSSRLSSATGNTLFKILLTAFRGKTINDYDYQVLAEQTMQSISATASGRTTDENIFLLFVEFAKLGTLMAATGDLDADGTVDGTYDNCSLSNSQGAHVVTAIGNIVDVLTVTGTTLAGANLAALQAACASMAGACNITDTASVTAMMNQVGRTLVGESNLGVGLAAPYNDPYCQLTTSPIDPVLAGAICPGGVGVASTICP
jgi:hypothetical protein